MKKILSILAFSLLSVSTVKADLAQTFYVRADAGVIVNNTPTVHSLKLSSGSAHSIDFGLGYNITNSFRTELIFSHLINPVMSTPEVEDAELKKTSNDRKVRGKINALILKGFYDIASLEAIKFFIGGGVGISQVSEKLTGTNRNLVKGHYGDSTNIIINHRVDEKLKKKINLAYALAGGISLKLNDIINVDFQYNWLDYGHAKPSNSGAKIKRRGHAIKMGVRLAL